MNKVLIATAVGVISFIAGLVGFYMAIPSVIPDRVAQAQAELDSLARVDSLLANPPPPVSPLAGVDSITTATLRGGMLDSLLDTYRDSTHLPVPLAAVMRDSIAALNRRIGERGIQYDSLQTQFVTLQEEMYRLQGQRAEAAALSGTLAKLEDKELRSILERLDLTVLELLFQQASSRNQARLLAAMPSERAARFVRGQVAPNAPMAPPVERTAAPGEGEDDGAEAPATDQPAGKKAAGTPPTAANR